MESNSGFTKNLSQNTLESKIENFTFQSIPKCQNATFSILKKIKSKHLKTFFCTYKYYFSQKQIWKSFRIDLIFLLCAKLELILLSQPAV